MKSFKKFVTEVSAQKASKDFEDYIWQLAVLSGGKETNVKKLTKLIDKKLSTVPTDKIEQTAKAVSHLNKKFKKKWTKGYNANFANKTKPEYGSKSAKADIVLESGNKKYGISIKMEGDIVVASAQGKDEFQSIFYSTLDYFEKKHSEVDLSEYKGNIKAIKKQVKYIKENFVGESITRKLKDGYFEKLRTRKEFADEGEFLDSLQKEIEKRNKENQNEWVEYMDNTRIKIVDDLKKVLQDNDKLHHYIVWEALSSILKYKGKLPSAQYILSPSGCYDITDPDSKYIADVAASSQIDFRGMLHGKIRSGAGVAIRYYLKKQDMGMTNIFDELNKMDISMKWDLKASKFNKLTKQNEGVVSDIWNKVKSVWNNIKVSISNAITKVLDTLNNMLNKLTQLESISVFGLIQNNGVEITGKIEIK